MIFSVASRDPVQVSIHSLNRSTRCFITPSSPPTSFTQAANELTAGMTCSVTNVVRTGNSGWNASMMTPVTDALRMVHRPEKVSS